MITLCTVKIDSHFLPFFIESLLRDTTLITEVVICNSKSSYANTNKFTSDLSDRRTVESNTAKIEYAVGKPSSSKLEHITFIEYPLELTAEFEGVTSQWAPSVHHCIGLQSTLDHVTNDWIMFCDTDVFFYPGMEKTYMDTMEKHKLNFIGVASQFPQSIGFFPLVTNMLVKKSDLPDPDFLVPHAPAAHFLWPLRCEELMSEFPKPDALIDTGYYLYLWAKRTNKNWFSFLPYDTHRYQTNYYRSNLKIKEKFPVQNILWHANGGSGKDREFTYLDQFKLALKDMLCKNSEIEAYESA